MTEFSHIKLDEEISAVKRAIHRLADHNDDKRIAHWIDQLERLVAIQYNPSGVARRINGEVK